jgi:hypothetical protein
MNKFVVFWGKYKFHFLFLFPLLYFFSGIYFRLILEEPSLRSVDPEYVYFMTGLNISEGHIKVIHIDHPGTPLQYMVAAVFRITHLLRGNSTEYVEDVLTHSDLYLSMVNLTTTAIMVITLLIAGFYVYKKTGSVLYGILIQTAPFISVILYEIIGRVTPEILIPLPIIAVTSFLIGHIADGKEKFSVREIVFISFIMGFGLAVKLTFLPIWIIPLILVSSWKERLLTMLLSVIFFLIIALPVTLQIEKFWNWGKDLFLHSGQYGTGEGNIVDFTNLKENLISIFNLQKHFTFSAILLIVIILISYFRLKKQKKPSLGRKIIISAAIVIMILIQTIISGKHYAPRYFLPALLFGPMLIFLIIEIAKELYSSKILNFGFMFLLTIFIIWYFKQQIGTINYTSQAFEQQIKAKSKTKEFAESINGESIKIIATFDFGFPVKENALLYSTIWSIHSLKPKYNDLLEKMYPKTYQYTLWGDNFHYWGESFNAEKIIEKEKPVYLLLENDNAGLYDKTMDKIFMNYNINKTLIFENHVTREQVFKLFINQKPTNEF